MASLQSTSTPPRGAPLPRRPAVVRAKLRVLTWNVWFGDLGADERHRALIDELETCDADVIGLQEVVPTFRKKLESSRHLTAVYRISPNEILRYGALLLVRRTLEPEFHELHLPTLMGRTAIWASLGVGFGGNGDDNDDGGGGNSSNNDDGNRDTAVATVHLESLDNEVARRLQLLRIAETLQCYPNALIMGDFNFDDRRSWGDWSKPSPARAPDQLENALTLSAALPGWTDCWPAVHGDGDDRCGGATFDGEMNRPAIRDPGEVMRYDRVMVRGTGLATPVAAVLRGTHAINSWGLRPSDHYAVCVDFE